MCNATEECARLDKCLHSIPHREINVCRKSIQCGAVGHAVKCEKPEKP